MRPLIIILALTSLLAVLVLLNNERMERQEQAYESYETCVLAAYGRSPASFFAEHGYAPECPRDISE